MNSQVRRYTYKLSQIAEYDVFPGIAELIRQGWKIQSTHIYTINDDAYIIFVMTLLLK